METSRIKIKVNSQVSNRISRVTKANRDKVEIRIKMVEHKIKVVKVSREVLKVIKDGSLRIIRTVIRLDKEMPITLRMDRDNSSLKVVSKILEINRTELVRMVNSSNSKEVNKDKCLICLELETKWDSKVSRVRVRILEVMVDNKVNKMVVVHQVKNRIRPEMEIHKVKVLEVIILTAIMMERKLLKML